MERKSLNPENIVGNEQEDEIQEGSDSEVNIAQEHSENKTSPEIVKKPQKFPFKLKQLDNGNILTVHHTVKEQDKLIRIRMAVGCFNERSSRFVTVDKRGNIFNFDLATKKFCRLWQKVPKASAITQMLHSNTFLIGTKLGHIIMVDIEKSNIVKAVEVSSESIVQLSFPGQPLQPSHLCLVHTGHEALLLNLDTFTVTHRLDFDEVRISLKFASYVPHAEQIFTCFTNDSVHIWSGVTLNTIRVAHPIKARDRKLKLTDETVPEISLSVNQQQLDHEFQFNCQDQDYSNGMITCYAFTPDGGTLCLSTLDNFLLIVNAITLEIQHYIRLKDFIMRECVFLRKSNESLILGITTFGQVVFIDYHHTDIKLIVQTEHAYHMSISSDGKLLAVLADTGEVDIWSTCKLYNILKSQMNCAEMLKAAFKQKKPVTVGCDNELFQNDIKKLLQHDRLVGILREYGCYPGKYRNLIWCTLLKLPGNRREFQQLVKMGVPNTVRERTRSLKIKKDANKRLTIKIWSCLAHWCKVFAYSEFIPSLIFPFVQIFQKNALVAFELCVTLLLNHFQLWFEFHPLEPSNYLGMCANVLQRYDKELHQFYVSKDILPKRYAWPLLSNAFSEVLDEEQWLCLWDNIITSPPYFLVFCAVAYNILQREVLLRLPNVETIDQFFHEQNPIDIAKLITKAYWLMDKCPDAVNPKRYMKNFMAIPKNVYPKFLNFPREWVQQHEEELAALQLEHRAIDARIRELELEEYEMMERLEKGLREEEHAKRMLEMEALYQNTLRREEERIACQRKMLLLYQKEIRNRKGEVLVTLQESERRKKALQMENDLDCLMHSIEKERLRNDSHLTLAEDELRNQELELVAQKYLSNLQQPSLAQKFRAEIQSLCNERNLLSKNLEKLDHLRNTPISKNIRGNLDHIESQIDDIQNEFLSLTSN